jgi:hypothetical protein
MPDDMTVSLSSGLPSTVLPDVPEDWATGLESAISREPSARRAAVAAVAAAHPTYLDAWAWLAENAEDPVEAYAYARVGYHRGLDALRAAGWRGSGYVRWSEQGNTGFLRSLAALQRAAAAIGEEAEAERCALFLRQLDPSYGAN